MKGKWYQNNITKALLVIMEHLLAVLVAVCIAWLAFNPGVRDELVSGEASAVYEESNAFENDLFVTAHNVFYSKDIEENMEVDGAYAPDKIVDVQTLQEEGIISNVNESGFAYRMEDLISWDSMYTYYSYADDSGEDAIVVCRGTDKTYHYYTYTQFADLIADGSLSLILNGDGENGTTSEDGILNELRTGTFFESSYYLNGVQDADGKLLYTSIWNYDGDRVLEEAKPIGAESVLDIVNNIPEWNGRLSEAYSLIQSTIDTVHSMYADYQEYTLGNAWQEGDTNFAYIYANTKTGEVNTNREEFKDSAKLEANIEKLKAMGKYVIVYPKLADFDSNVEKANANEWRDFFVGQNDMGEDFVCAVAVDTSYPIPDEFYQNSQDYNTFGPHIRQFEIVAIMALILMLLGLVWLTTVAGKRPGSEEVHLTFFDRIKTELAAAIVALVWLVGFFGIFLEFGYYWMDADEQLVVTIWVSMMAVFTCAMFLVGYLSLVRRIKAKTLWKDSLLRTVIKILGAMRRQIKYVWKQVILIGAFLLFHWFIILNLGYGYGGYILIVFLVEAAAFIYMMRRVLGEQRVRSGVKKIASGEVDYKIPTEGLSGDNKILAEEINAIGEGLDIALKETMKSERLKTDLITNVSHDIKTPLTSIINYIDLLKQENFEDPKIQRYIEVLEQKAQRLKTLTEDVVEASKVSSGNINLEKMNLNLVELIQQTSGEFEEKFKARNLTEILQIAEETALVYADGRRTWRILENIYNNAAKYAMEGTRIYANLEVDEEYVKFHLKNVSEQPLGFKAEELTERFIRGDISRSTEGSGLGLSIAKTLTEMQGGTFEIFLDGDLFTVTLTFPKVTCVPEENTVK